MAAPQDGKGAEVVWLFDPDDAPDPETCTAGALRREIQRIVGGTLGLVAVRGVVGSVRRGDGRCTFELVDHTAGQEEHRVNVVVEGDDLRAVETELLPVGLEIVVGATTTVSGTMRLDLNGRFFIAATAVEIHPGDS